MKEEIIEEEPKERKIVIPGEIIYSGEKYLPGEGTTKSGNNIISIIYGLAEESRGLVKVIPVSGVYNPRRGNVVIGKIENVTFNGWVVNIDSAASAFLPVMEYPRFVNKNDIAEVMDIGDLVAAKILSVKRKSIDLTLKFKGLGKLEGGIITKINPNKVPRVIGKEGSMVTLIKDETKCNITVGQNGLIWIKGNSIEDELLAKRAIMFVSEKSFLNGLTEKVKEWFEKEKK